MLQAAFSRAVQFATAAHCQVKYSFGSAGDAEDVIPVYSSIIQRVYIEDYKGPQILQLGRVLINFKRSMDGLVFLSLID